jgi:phosphatidylserine/phosphatidylglycerophosphate/cardiolipin synthase-like enzyme
MTLHQRALARTLAIEFFIHLRAAGKNQQMTPSNFFAYTSPWTDVIPDVYYDARADGDEEQGTMHAKRIAGDESAAFITPANFTAAAQTINVEVGVLVRHAEFAQRVVAQWCVLAARGLIRRLNASPSMVRDG